MPAESICAAHSAVTETSAHPVSKSSLKERLHDPTPTQKRLCMGWARHIRPKLVAAMSVGGHSRPNWPVGAMSAIPPIATELRTSLVVRFVPKAEDRPTPFAQLDPKDRNPQSRFLYVWMSSERLLRNPRGLVI